LLLSSMSAVSRLGASLMLATSLSFIKDKEVASIRLDPNRETADIDESNNSWPAVTTESRFEIFRAKQQLLRSIPQTNNPMQLTGKDKKAF